MGNANKQGSTLKILKNSSKLKRNGNNSLEQKRLTVKFRAQQKQKEKEKDTSNKQKKQYINNNKRRREHLEGMRYERRGGWQKRRRN